MAGSLSLAVRTLHVLGMAVLLGGAAALWYAAHTADGNDLDHALARGYEWAFWGALGLMVVSGVGNLGALGAPGPDTRWGTILMGKLVLLVAFVLGSVVRTLAVVLPSDAGVSARFGRRAYGATTAVLLALVGLAEVLAHG